MPKANALLTSLLKVEALMTGQFDVRCVLRMPRV